MANNVNFKVKNGLVIGGDAYLNNASYLHGKLLNGTDTRMFGINSANTLYIGSIDTATGGDWIFINGAERMRINAAGTVRINTASNLNTNAQFSVYASDQKVMELYSGGSLTRLMLANDNNLNTIDSNNGALTFNYNPGTLTEAGRFTVGGAFTVGRTSQYATYDIASFEKSANADYGISISNQNSTAGSYARLTLGAYGADWNLRVGAAATNNTAFTIGRAAVEMLRITSAGNVGIGTSNPSEQLHLGRATYPTLKLEETTTGNVVLLQHHSGASETQLTVVGAYPLVFKTSNIERLRISAAGNVGIKNISPSHTVDIGQSTDATNELYVNAAASGVARVYANTWGTSSAALVANNSSSATGDGVPANTLGIAFNGGLPATFVVNAVERMRIDSSGNVGVGITPKTWGSDYRAVELGTYGRLYSSSNGKTGFAANATFNGTNWIAGITTVGSLYEQPLDGSGHVFSTAASTTAGATMTFTERMRIDSSGNVGIGTSAPTRALHVRGTAASASIENTSTAAGDFVDLAIVGNDTTGRFSAYGSQHSSRANQVWLNANTSSSLVLGTNNTERVRITSAGDVGIGTGSPQRKLHVVGDAGIAVSDTATGAITTLAATTTVTSIDCYTTNVAGQAFVVRTNSTGGTGTAERFRITSTGQIGINTSLPSFDFDLQKSQNAASVMRVYNGNTGASASSVIVAQSDTVTLNMFANGSGNTLGSVASLAGIQVTTNTPFGIWTNNAERIRITASSGYIGINGNTNGVVAGLQHQLALYHAGASSVYGIGIRALNNSTTTQALTFANASDAQVGCVSVTASATTYSTTSDRRLKENVQPAGSFGSKIDQIEVVSFDWKADGKHQEAGFIAQDLYKVAPDAVHVGDADDVEVLKHTWGVDASKLVPMLIKEIQELRARVAALETK